LSRYLDLWISVQTKNWGLSPIFSTEGQGSLVPGFLKKSNKYQST
jgi:hypothetical protein